MLWTIVALLCLIPGLPLFASGGQKPSYPSFDKETARDHEIKPHRQTFPVAGMDQEEYTGAHYLNLKLTVSPAGDVTHAETNGEFRDEDMQFWPQVEGEVYQWKFTPFTKGGKAVIAEVYESIVLVPPERLPKTHVASPPITKNSQVVIALRRQWCDGTCDFHNVTVSTDGIVFWGTHGVADGTHTDKIDNDTLLALAKKIVAADFYSMEDSYCGAPIFSSSLSISIDGHVKSVRDCVGQWAGIPTVILELEDEVDAVARVRRWTKGEEGLVAALRAEKFDFASYDAQRILENAAVGGQTATVRELLLAGVPVKPLPVPQKDNPDDVASERVRLLAAASAHPDTLQVFLDSGVSRDDQKDKDLALDFAARAGKLEAVRALISYGANPNADLSRARIATVDPNVIIGQVGPGNILIDAARSGIPEVVKEILRYRPNLETKNYKGETALFVASESTRSDEDERRAECVRLLAKAGARVDVRDKDGNTPLHKSYLLDVDEELLRLGADVNARNHNGETPIFTNMNIQVLPLFLLHKADLTIRNNRGENVIEARKGRGNAWDEALHKEIARTSR
jgi:ankyrin repeat protein